MSFICISFLICILILMNSRIVWIVSFSKVVSHQNTFIARWMEIISLSLLFAEICTILANFARIGHRMIGHNDSNGNACAVGCIIYKNDIFFVRKVFTAKWLENLQIFYLKNPAGDGKLTKIDNDTYDFGRSAGVFKIFLSFIFVSIINY